MEVPVELVDWLVQYAASNVELAVISNVSQSWRNRAILALLKPSGTSSGLLLPSMLASFLPHTNNAESFCAAWFPPEGIQIVPVPLDSDSDDDSTFHSPSTRSKSFAFGQHENRQKLSRSDSSSSFLNRNCSNEWKGYSQAWEVLAPFGYARSFVEQTMELAQKQGTAERKTKLNNGTTSIRNLFKSRTYKYKRETHATTIAVRGATFARPEGYCLCWDYDDSVEGTQVPPKPDDDDNEEKCLSRQEVIFKLLRHRSKNRRVLQQEMLPRVVISSPSKNNKNELEGGQHPCLQFLNSSGNNAVRLHTPPFDCGELRGPITVFCVGIATEDGCFFSGLKRQCQLGHMYPINGRDDLIDMSPICIATEKLASQTQLQDKAPRGFESDDSSCDSEGGGQRQEQIQTTACDCPFDCIPGENDPEEEREPVNEECIHRGQRGPGNWHCYVAIFAGSESMIRVDGMSEHLPQCNKTGEMEEIAMDGLTIGSDHCFDMTLCCGEGCEEEGEGAISELVVFQGQLDIRDIEELEDYLMRKHKIQKCCPGNQRLILNEDEWRRQARALIVQPSPYALMGPVPLSIVAQDRAVAWKRVNAVTGENLRIGRIGSKFSTGSSDW
jgi:hypothetical protein